MARRMVVLRRFLQHPEALQMVVLQRKLLTFIINETLKTLYIHITDELKVVNPRSPGAANTSM